MGRFRNLRSVGRDVLRFLQTQLWTQPRQTLVGSIDFRYTLNRVMEPRLARAKSAGVDRAMAG
jgi:hypothetical protein